MRSVIDTHPMWHMTGLEYNKVLFPTPASANALVLIGILDGSLLCSNSGTRMPSSLFLLFLTGLGFHPGVLKVGGHVHGHYCGLAGNWHTLIPMSQTGHTLPPGCKSVLLICAFQVYLTFFSLAD